MSKEFTPVFVVVNASEKWSFLSIRYTWPGENLPTFTGADTEELIRIGKDIFRERGVRPIGICQMIDADDKSILDKRLIS